MIHQADGGRHHFQWWRPGGIALRTTAVWAPCPRLPSLIVSVVLPDGGRRAAETVELYVRGPVQVELTSEVRHDAGGVSPALGYYSMEAVRSIFPQDSQSWIYTTNTAKPITSNFTTTRSSGVLTQKYTVLSFYFYCWFKNRVFTGFFRKQNNGFILIFSSSYWWSDSYRWIHVQAGPPLATSYFCWKWRLNNGNNDDGICRKQLASKKNIRKNIFSRKMNLERKIN